MKGDAAQLSNIADTLSHFAGTLRGISEHRAHNERTADLLHERVQEVSALLTELTAARREAREATRRASRLEERYAELRRATAENVVVMPATPDSIHPRGSYVYCLHGADDEVIYVGMSDNVFGRLGQHARDPLKGPETVRVSLVLCEDRRAAAALEAALIAEWRPLHNVVGIPYDSPIGGAA